MDMAISLSFCSWTSALDVFGRIGRGRIQWSSIFCRDLKSFGTVFGSRAGRRKHFPDLIVQRESSQQSKLRLLNCSLLRELAGPNGNQSEVSYERLRTCADIALKSRATSQVLLSTSSSGLFGSLEDRSIFQCMDRLLYRVDVKGRIGPESALHPPRWRWQEKRS